MMNLEDLKQSELAELLLVDPRQVRNYDNENPPIPSKGRGPKRKYAWRQVFPWLVMRIRRQLETQFPQSDVPNEKIERARLLKVQRENLEIENAKKRSEVVTLDLVSKTVEELITPARINLLSLRAKLEVEIGREAAERVDKEIKKILIDLGGGEE